MNFLEEKILSDGTIKEGNILKIDNFLNHQIDIDIIRQIAYIEASGIAIATLLGEIYDVPIVFAKKGETANSTDDKYIAQAYSFTHKKHNNVFVSKPYMLAGEKVLIVDDFLADGQAMGALVDIVHQAGAEVVGLAVAVEKGQQNGGKNLRAKGYQVESVAIIDSMDYKTGKIVFRN